MKGKKIEVKKYLVSFVNSEGKKVKRKLSRAEIKAASRVINLTILAKDY